MDLNGPGGSFRLPDPLYWTDMISFLFGCLDILSFGYFFFIQIIYLKNEIALFKFKYIKNLNFFFPCFSTSIQFGYKVILSFHVDVLIVNIRSYLYTLNFFKYFK